jgi:3-methyladenine DNA glycosylase AlkD
LVAVAQSLVWLTTTPIMRKTAKIGVTVAKRVDAIGAILKDNAHATNAAAMTKYMRGQFPYFGIKSPVRTEIGKEWIRETSKDLENWDHDLVRALWTRPEREFKYVAMDLLLYMKGKIRVEDLDLIEYMIDTESWWDTVDLIASHFLGTLVQRYPHIKESHIRKWGVQTDPTPSMWLKRSAILSQLKLKKHTDELLLAECIEANMNTDEFFLNKAIGWILREYSKTNQQFVKNFLKLHENSLSSLSVREASKYLTKSARK